MPTLRLLIEYDGTEFVGWQIQANGRSVQQEITRVLEQIVQERVTLIGAGRTDAGVHARGQVASFRTNSRLTPEVLARALRGLLPPDVSVHAVQLAPPDFHARYDARERVYSYTITRKHGALSRRFQWYVKHRLDIGLMNAAAAMVLGKHDFRTFSRAGDGNRGFECTVNCSAWRELAPLLVYEISADRFLHGMVRALVGTMTDVGRGFTTPSRFLAALEACDRRRGGMTAPPHGLVLEHVRYDCDGMAS